MRLRARLRRIRGDADPDGLAEFDPGPFDEEAFESRLAWIFGSPRTGSTWLLHLLTFPLQLTKERPSGSIMPRRAPVRPLAVPINEPYLPNHLVPILDGFADPGAPNFLLASTRAGDPNYFFAEEFAPWWRPEVRHLTLVRLHAQAELAARAYSLVDPLVVVKEPNGSHGADQLMSTLRRSRLIFQLRDGRDVIDSMVHAQSRQGWRAGPDGSAAIEGELQRLDFVRSHSRLWVNRTLAVERAYDSHPPELRTTVRYEDLRANTIEILRPLVDWLGMQRTDEELEAIVEALAFESYPDRAKGPTKALRTASPGLWRENMSEAEQRVMNEVMGETLERLGYRV